jgi:hypothetical protein
MNEHYGNDLNSKKSITCISDANDLTTAINLLGLDDQNKEKPIH